MSFFPSPVSSIFRRMKNPPSLRMRVLERETKRCYHVLVKCSDFRCWGRIYDNTVFPGCYNHVLLQQVIIPIMFCIRIDADIKIIFVISLPDVRNENEGLITWGWGCWGCFLQQCAALWYCDRIVSGWWASSRCEICEQGGRSWAHFAEKSRILMNTSTWKPYKLCYDQDNVNKNIDLSVQMMNIVAHLCGSFLDHF